MRITVFLAIVLCGAALPPSASATEVRQAGPVQSLFLGDRRCGDDTFTCSFIDLVPLHRFLHVVVHALPGDASWRVQVGSSCDGALTVAGGEPIAPSGYLETVVDLEATGESPGCVVFRGRNGDAATYYAAYLDDVAEQDANEVYPGYEGMAGRPDLADLDVQYIERTPRYPYDALKSGPAPGDRVVFRARVANAGGLQSGGFTFTWRLDRKVVETGAFSGSLGPGEATVLVFPWTWQTAPHDLSLSVRSPQPEITLGNNALTVRTNALSLGIWVESSEYTYFQTHQWLYCREVSCWGSDSFADWLQRQIRAWNGILQHSVSPLAPAGAVDRVRVDEITVVPDGALPLDGGLPTNDPNRADHTVDLEWGIPSKTTAGEFGFSPASAFDLDWALIHELSHARSLADLYRFDVSATERHISVSDSAGKPIFNPSDPFSPASKLHAFPDPPNPPFLYQDLERDLMACPCAPFYSPYSIVLLNRIQGRRARCGNTNPPCNLGDWYLDLPPVIRLRILDRAGAPIADGTPVRLYSDYSTAYSGHAFDQSHRVSLLSRGGVVTLLRDPFDAHGSTWVAGHNLLLLEVADSGDEFCFLEPTTFNIAYWEGYRTRATPAVFTMRLGRQFQNGCGLTTPRAIVNEPFATSPNDSTVRVNVAGRGREVVVHLVDGARPHHAMRARLVRLVGLGGKVLGSGVTGEDGTARIALRRLVRFRVIDVTDNDLPVTSER